MLFRSLLELKVSFVQKRSSVCKFAGQAFVDGKLDRTLRGERIVAEFLELLDDYVARRYPAREGAASR